MGMHAEAMRYLAKSEREPCFSAKAPSLFGFAFEFVSDARNRAEWNARARGSVYVAMYVTERTCRFYRSTARMHGSLEREVEKHSRSIAEESFYIPSICSLEISRTYSRFTKCSCPKALPALRSWKGNSPSRSSSFHVHFHNSVIPQRSPKHQTLGTSTRSPPVFLTFLFETL